MTYASLSNVETPSVLLDLPRVIRNIEGMQQRADSHRIRLRPHAKTHKSLEIAKLQLASGAVGITASKTDEALVFINAGIKSVTVAYPILYPAKLDRLLKAASSQGVDLRLMADSQDGIGAISAAASRLNAVVPVFLKIDVGLHRCGLREDDSCIVPCVAQIVVSPHLRFQGLLSHAGHSYAAASRDEVQGIAQDECQILKRVRCRIEQAGFDVAEVSVGATPTALASTSYDGITEIRPGNYVFMDLTPVRLGLISPDQIALSVLATVVSANQDYLIIDAGSKVFSSDLGAHGTGAGVGYGCAYAIDDFNTRASAFQVVKLSEEHGFLKRAGDSLQVGSRVRVFPNHSCAVVNLADSFVVLNGDERAAVRWPVDARGCVS